MQTQTFDKTYIGGFDKKPKTFDRIEFATKALLQQINKTQSLYATSAHQMPAYSNQEYWYAVMANLHNDQNYQTSNQNDDFLEHLKNTEKHLGLSALKIKRTLCINCKNRLIIASIYAVISMITAIGGIMIANYFGYQNAGIMPALIGCGLLFAVSIIQTIRVGKSYIYNRNKKTDVINTALKFQQTKNIKMNEAEKFIIRRIEQFLNAAPAND